MATTKVTTKTAPLTDNESVKILKSIKVDIKNIEKLMRNIATNMGIKID